MIRHFARTIALLTMLGILYSGPVVACVCPDHMPAMPCCPVDDGGAGQASYVKTELDAHSACDPVSASNLLTAKTPDPRAPAAIAEAPRPPLPYVLPAARITATHPPYVARPIYLVTERRRE